MMSHGAQQPPVRELPVAVPGDLVLVREPGLVVSAGCFAVSSAGFEFTLRTAFDVSDPAVRVPASLAVHLDEREHDTWLEVGFADGRRCEADLNTNTWPGGSRDITMRFRFGDSSRSEGLDLSRWWVSPLPPPGPVELVVHLNGAAGPTGRASLSSGFHL
jgi:hypothetical protein